MARKSNSLLFGFAFVAAGIGEPGNRAIVVELEGADTSVEPALIETRFWFEGGRYRFRERASDTYDPEIAKQPGRWHGALDVHGADSQ